MKEQTLQQRPTKPTVSLEEVKRVLEVGRLLLSVLRPEELRELEKLLSKETSPNEQSLPEKKVTRVSLDAWSTLF